MVIINVIGNILLAITGGILVENMDDIIKILFNHQRHV